MYIVSRILFVGLILLLTQLIGCESDEPSREVTNAYQLPSGLEDCGVYSVKSTVYSPIHIMRCPKAVTTTKEIMRRGKSTITLETVIIDGVEYKLTPKETK